MTINISDKHHCIFVHIPKAAGTSIKQALQLSGQGHPTWLNFAQWTPNHWRDYLTFAVVRDPYERFVSAYRYARMPESYWHGKANPHPDLATLKDLNLHECALLLKNNRQALKHESWHPQSVWICDEQNQVKIDRVLRFSHLQQDFDRLCSELGLPPKPLPAENRSSGTEEDGQQETIALIREIYAQDYQLLEGLENQHSGILTGSSGQANPPLPRKTAALHHNSELLWAWFNNGDHQQVNKYFVAWLSWYTDAPTFQLDRNSRYHLYRFALDFLTIFVDERFRIPKDRWLTYLSSNATISNLVAATPLETTDHFLQLLLDRPYEHNLSRILTLYSARNNVAVDKDQMFNHDPQLSQIWYSSYFRNYTQIAAKESLDHLREHLLYQHSKLEAYYWTEDLYYGATYADQVNDRHLKQRINHALQAPALSPVYENQPAHDQRGRKKVAVFSDLWFKTHSVYRNQSEFITSLKDDYHVTLIHTPNARNLDQEMFDEVICLPMQGQVVSFEPILKNDFHVFYLPDVGMNETSIRLANQRVAPIQMCGVGHSVSTFGAQIDYYISGADVEPAEGADNNYSERLVALPGYGIVHNPISYQRTVDKVPVDTDLLINCPWTAQKTNFEILELLAAIAEQAGRPVKYRFFPGGTARRFNGQMPFRKDIGRVLREENYVVYSPMPYDTYMAEMEQAHLTFDAFPYGGCNTVADAAHLRKPTLAYEGISWYNRIGPTMLKSIGLEELVATNNQEYVEKGLRLVQDDAYRNKITDYLLTQDIDKVIFANESSRYFKRAFDYLVENHETLKQQGNKPITVADFGEPDC